MSHTTAPSTTTALPASLPLGVQFTGLVLMTVLLPLAIYLAFAVPFTVESLINSDSRKLELQSEQAIRELERIVERRINGIRMLSQADVFEQDNIQEIDQYLTELLLQHPDISSLVAQCTVSNQADVFVSEAIAPETESAIVLLTPITDDSNQIVVKILLAAISR